MKPKHYRITDTGKLVATKDRLGSHVTATSLSEARTKLLTFARRALDEPPVLRKQHGATQLAYWRLDHVNVEAGYQPQRFKNWPPYHSIEENLLTNSTLPSIVFRRNKSCSQKWKITPQDKWTGQWEPALSSWASGMQVRKMIGYDAGPADIRRRDLATGFQDPLFSYEYPLISQGWDREKCKQVIASAGLPVPEKSACYFCPSTKPEELHVMDKELLRRIVVIEARSKDKMQKVQGLWGTATRKRPGSMSEYIVQHRLLDPDEVAAIQAATPTEPLYQGDIDNWQDFLSTLTGSGCNGCTACSAA